MRDHFEQAAPRRMIFPVNLEVLSQMLDPVREECDLYIRAAGIFIMQLELLEIRRLVALSHNEAPSVAEEAVLATAIIGRFAKRIADRIIPFLPGFLKRIATQSEFRPNPSRVFRRTKG